MNNNQDQSFQKGQSAQPPRSPEKLEGSMRDNKPGINSDDKTKSAGSDSQEFKPERKTVAADSKKSLGTDSEEGSKESTSACGTGCGSGKVN